MRRLALALVFAACKPHAPPMNTKPPDAGVSIALYAKDGDGYGVVDDRRWIDITGKTMMLANIDPGAELASLVIEPASSDLALGACTREQLPSLPAAKDPLADFAREQERRTLEPRRITPRRPVVAPRPPPEPTPAPPKPVPDDTRFVPVVRCDVAAKPGRYLVRILYVTKALGYRAQHDIELTGEHAHVTSRFAITTPVWQERAELAIFDGIPGGDRAPQEVARGQVTLDGSTSVLAVPPRDLPAELRRVYEGAVVTTTDSQDVMWGHESVQAVWVWLELAKLRLAPGPVHVHLDLPGEGVRDLDVPQASRKQDDTPDAPLRLPLWVDEGLRGSRQRMVEYNDGSTLTERYVLAVVNTGEVAREVWVEEPVRKAQRRRLERAWPKKPVIDHDRLRTKLDVKGGHSERTGYTLSYDF